MIEHLQVKNWRAVSDLSLSFKEGLTFIMGENGSGKTTLLESIAVALIGEALTGDLHHSVREENSESEISITLRAPTGTRVSVRRRFRRDRKLPGELVIDGRLTAVTAWEETTTRILELLSIDRALFARLVCIPGREIFSYLRDPAAEALRHRMEQVLGIQLLGSLEHRVARLARDHVTRREDALAELRKFPHPSPRPSDPAELAATLEAVQLEERDASPQLERLLSESSRLESSLTEIRRLRDLFAELPALLGRPLPADTNVRELLDTTLASLREEVRQREEAVRSAQAEVGAAKNAADGLRDVRRMLDRLLRDTALATVSCPVCQRPIDAQLASQLRTRIDDQIALADEQLRQRTDEVTVRQRELRERQEMLERVDRLNVRLSQQILSLTSTEITSIASVDARASALEQELQGRRSEADRLRVRIQSLRATISRGTEDLMSARLLGQQAERQAALQERAVTAFEAELLCEIISDVAGELSQQQRSEKLSSVYAAISDLWRRFRPDRDWHIEVDSDGFLHVKSQDRDLHFSQLSGGEKTVLLVLARVVLCKMLSALDFMLIDEPLEHLDLRNRRSLVNFLVEAHRKQLMPQLIVTTFEVTLVRKFYQAPDVTPVMLSRSS